jgi:hypothetical protein
MTQLRDRMLEELERRNYSPGTAKAYLYAVQQFAEHFHRSPDRFRQPSASHHADDDVLDRCSPGRVMSAEDHRHR